MIKVFFIYPVSYTHLDYDLLRYAKQGIIIPLENLIDKYMPNLQAVFEKYPEYRTMVTAPVSYTHLDVYKRQQ